MAEPTWEQPELTDPADERFSAEIELVRHSAKLPRVSRRLRERVVQSAASAFRTARRWTQFRYAAALLLLSLGTSWLVSPLAPIVRSRQLSLAARFTQFRASVAAMHADFVAGDRVSLQPMSAWSFRRDPDLFDFQSTRPILNAPAQRPASIAVAHTETLSPRDELLAALKSSEGWATVEAFQALRSRKAGWAN